MMKTTLLTVLIFSITISTAFSQTCNTSINAGSGSQTVCLDSAITFTEYDVNDATMSVLGLPQGVTGQYHQLYCITTPCPSHMDISGNPHATGVYTYTLWAPSCTTSGPATTGKIIVSVSGACSRNCVANFTDSYDTTLNQFTLYVDSAAVAKSYSWDFGDGATSTLAQPGHVYTADTTYNVCLTATTAANNSCTYCHKIGKNYKGNIFRTAGFTIKVVNPNELGTGISTESSTENGVAFFPNPTEGKTELLFKKTVYNTAIVIFNNVGQKISEQLNFTGKSYSIDLTNHPSGTYFIEIIEPEHSVSKLKIIKL